MKNFYKIKNLKESPGFLKKINTIEDSIKADNWGRDKVTDILEKNSLSKLI